MYICRSENLTLSSMQKQPAFTVQVSINNDRIMIIELRICNISSTTCEESLVAGQFTFGSYKGCRTLHEIPTKKSCLFHETEKY